MLEQICVIKAVLFGPGILIANERVPRLADELFFFISDVDQNGSPCAAGGASHSSE